MKRLALLTLAAAMVGACQDAPTENPAMRPSLAAATTMTTNESVPFSIGVFVACANGGAGELVMLSGELHILTHVTETANGKLSVKTHFQPQGVSGEGTVTGDKYQATGVTQDIFNLNGGLPQTFSYVNNFRIIGQGPDNNFLVHENVHTTINANGEVTSTVDNFSTECK